MRRGLESGLSNFNGHNDRYTRLYAVLWLTAFPAPVGNCTGCRVVHGTVPAPDRVSPPPSRPVPVESSARVTSAETVLTRRLGSHRICVHAFIREGAPANKLVPFATLEISVWCCSNWHGKFPPNGCIRNVTPHDSRLLCRFLPLVPLGLWHGCWCSATRHSVKKRHAIMRARIIN